MEFDYSARLETEVEEPMKNRRFSVLALPMHRLTSIGVCKTEISLQSERSENRS